MAIMAAGQAAMGGVQSLQADIARRKAERDFQKYKVPGGVQSMLNVLHGMASQTEVPGADLVKQKLASATARGVETSQRTARSSTDVLGALHRLYSSQMDRELDLAVAGANNYQANRARLAQGLQTLGQYQTQKWQYNELYPYMQKMTEAGQLSAAGGANIAGALKSGVSLAAYGAQMDAMKAPGAPSGESATTPLGITEYSNTPQMNKNFWMNTLSAPQPQPELPQFSTGTPTNQSPWMASAWGSTVPASGYSPQVTQSPQTLSPVFRSYEDSNQYVPPSWRIPQIPPRVEFVRKQ